MLELNDSTWIYGLVGHPLGHSFSARYFKDFFAVEGLDARYVNLDLPSLELLRPAIDSDERISGLNVTIPYKQEVIPMLDELSDEARAIGAVNVIEIDRSGATTRLIGHNTDCQGFTTSVKELIPAGCTRGMVLGTGGASRAVAHALMQLGLEVVKVSRTPSEGQYSYEQLSDNGLVADCHVIVNTTPLGMWPNTDQAPQIAYAQITGDHVCIDIVYNPAVTQFMQLCAAKGATVKNGLQMLVEQARASWRIWTKENPPKTIAK